MAEAKPGPTWRVSRVSDCPLLPTLLQDDQDGAFVKWRVENSWGEDHGHKGELTLGMPAQGAWSLLCSLPQDSM